MNNAAQRGKMKYWITATTLGKTVQVEIEANNFSSAIAEAEKWIMNIAHLSARRIG